jgi:hypothetical protein
MENPRPTSMAKPRTYFFRCPDCGSEFLHTVDLAVEGPADKPPTCHCGATMAPAGIPRLVMPAPGGDGHTWEVQEMKREEQS